MEEELFRVLRLTAENRSSMLQDVVRGKPTEADSLSGVILRTGSAHGLKLPHTERIYRRLMAKQPKD